MDQPHYAVEYLGAISAEKNKLVTSASVLVAFPTANMMKMKTEGVSVSVDGTDMFLTSFDDESFITSGKSFIFDKNCTIAIGKYVAVV